MHSQLILWLYQWPTEEKREEWESTKIVISGDGKELFW